MNQTNDLTVMELSKLAHFDIVPCSTNYDFDNKNRFTKLAMTSGQRMQLSGLAQQIPAAMAGNAMANAYLVRFPEGLPHTLTALKQGGFGSMLKGEGGTIVGSASFFEMTTQAALLNVFTAMSAVTGQYFLAEINSRMDKMNQKLDKILEFLYSEKKAELLAELNFVRYAHQNFTSIMTRDSHRLATIIGLQNSQKIALKDIEFYTNDLDATATAKAKNYEELVDLCASAQRIHNCLDLSMQLYVAASLLEVYYSDNFDKFYLKNVDDMVSLYIGRYERQALASFSKLKARIEDIKPTSLKKVDKAPVHAQLQNLIDRLNQDEESVMRKTLHSVLYATNQNTEYYLTASGDVYCSN